MPTSQFGWKRQFDYDEEQNGDRIISLHCEESFRRGIQFKAKV